MFSGRLSLPPLYGKKTRKVVFGLLHFNTLSHLIFYFKRVIKGRTNCDVNLLRQIYSFRSSRIIKDLSCFPNVKIKKINNKHEKRYKLGNVSKIKKLLSIKFEISALLLN